ncbi:hypothetical protein BDB00DRAFT_791033 [Zychaea mexicana]|uniref:uncharacterized protein n=1 Tax=Zychaea mexicana TaxID=64656 RepID=UPI0022FE15FB|nr:uncharacterized protein BDB00DRAFT_791033 [Zychaea mexicana]KAI9489524.1 hypothetical protein BDB00DRAFT_791033 [Zychaea mexicana]
MAKVKKQSSPKQQQQQKRKASARKGSVTKPRPTKEQIEEAARGLKSLKKYIAKQQAKTSTALNDEDRAPSPIALVTEAIRSLTLETAPNICEEVPVASTHLVDAALTKDKEVVEKDKEAVAKEEITVLKYRVIPWSSLGPHGRVVSEVRNRRPATRTHAQRSVYYRVL